VIIGVIAALYIYREFTAPPPLGLRVSEKDGEMSVNWDPNSRPIQWSDEGKLEIRSAAADKLDIVLTQAQLAKGSYQYEASEGDTSIRLSVTGRMGFHAEEGTRFLGQISHPEPKKLIEIYDRRKLQTEVKRLREELDKSNQRVKELESLLYNR